MVHRGSVNLGTEGCPQTTQRRYFKKKKSSRDRTPCPSIIVPRSSEMVRKKKRRHLFKSLRKHQEKPVLGGPEKPPTVKVKPNRGSEKRTSLGGSREPNTKDASADRNRKRALIGRTRGTPQAAMFFTTQEQTWNEAKSRNGSKGTKYHHPSKVRMVERAISKIFQGDKYKW